MGMTWIYIRYIERWIHLYIFNYRLFLFLEKYMLLYSTWCKEINGNEHKQKHIPGDNYRNISTRQSTQLLPAPNKLVPQWPLPPPHSNTGFWNLLGYQTLFTPNEGPSKVYNILMVSRRIKVGALLPYDKARMKTNGGACRSLEGYGVWERSGGGWASLEGMGDVRHRRYLLSELCTLKIYIYISLNALNGKIPWGNSFISELLWISSQMWYSYFCYY